MEKSALSIEQYVAVARQAAAEGIVLLKNKNSVLPLSEGSSVSVFGRTQMNYYKSGTGSGGMVNAPYVIGILDALKEEKLELNKELMQIYQDWTAKHPFNRGKGWGQEPWSQEEMPLEDALVASARKVSDTAIVIIGRTAGEDQDAVNDKGSYQLSDLEEEMLAKVCAAFPKTIVLLNVGSIIDMNWVQRYDPAAVLYVWQGGMEGGNGVADVLMGRVNPCGKLTDTIAKEIEDYPSNKNYGDPVRNFYAEDIYVGYRYFETFAKEKVLYPFGFGLSYTDFAVHTESFQRGEATTLRVAVKNIGSHPGKEVVQVYVQAPQGLLGKPLRSLVDFGKTKVLQPGETEILEFSVSDYRISSYDDSGVTGHPYCYVLEAGEYIIHVGTSVRDCAVAGTFTLSETKVLEQLRQSAAPQETFLRLIPEVNGDSVEQKWEQAPLRKKGIAQHIAEAVLPQIPYTGDKGYKLVDVYQGRVSLDDFVAQLSDNDLCCIVKGEGMCSPKVTPGTAAAFGGLTDSLASFGIPCGCCSDGPSGIRMDCGTLAFSLPGGYSLACTFNKELVELLYTYEGGELRVNRIDTLLGPGMNIHRHPLNGRNFEYFSEDPILTGEIAAAQLKGMGKYGVTGTIKHFACNNQEFHRRDVDPAISERALREIYLKGFEIAVKDAQAYSVMTTYGPLNGVWTAGNYDLCTRILREEWGFDGMVMSDWGADINEEGTQRNTQQYAAMVRAQNDVFMTILDTQQEMGDLAEAMAEGRLTRGHLARSAKNVLKFLLRSPVIQRVAGEEDPRDGQVEGLLLKQPVRQENITMLDFEEGMYLDVSELCTDAGSDTTYYIRTKDACNAFLRMSVKVDAAFTAQVPVSVFNNNTVTDSVTLAGTNGQWVDVDLNLAWLGAQQNYVRLHFAMGGMQIREMRIFSR